MTSNLTKAEKIIKGVENGSYPEKLYRFRSFDEKGYWKDIFTKKELYFSTPNNFNDPFDCKPVIKDDYSKEQLVDALGIYSLEFRKVNSNFNIDFKKGARKLLDSYKICCFTKGWNIPLLWSHYAAGHTGFCLEFEIIKDPYCFFEPVNVNYVSERPTYDHLNERGKSFEKCIASKDKIWEYEKEVRVVKSHREESDFFKFKPESLTVIYIGSNASELNIMHLIAILFSSNLTHVKLYKLTPDEKIYNFNKEEIIWQ